MTDCTSMIESLKITRACWLSGPHQRPFALVRFTISWTMAAGYQREDVKTFDGHDLLDLERGTVPMLTPIYTLPYEGHPGACTVGMAYLIRTHDVANDLEDVEARLAVRPNNHADAESRFEIPPLVESGRNIHPLTIEEIVR